MPQYEKEESYSTDDLSHRVECALPGEKDASGSSKRIQDDIKKCAVIHSPFESTINKEEKSVEQSLNVKNGASIDIPQSESEKKEVNALIEQTVVLENNRSANTDIKDDSLSEENGLTQKSTIPPNKDSLNEELIADENDAVVAVEGIEVIEAIESPDGKQDVEDDLISSEEETDDLSIGFPEIPKEAKQILRSIKGKPLARDEIMERVLRRVIPSEYNPTGLEISISSISANDWMGTSQGPGGVGKSVLAAMVACKEGVRKYYSGGIAWLDMGNREDEMSYSDYCDLLRSLYSQLFTSEEKLYLPSFFLISGEHVFQSEMREKEFCKSSRQTFSALIEDLPGPVLIILDNLKHKHDLDLFKFDCKVKGKGSNIVATTRMKELVNVDRCIPVGCLTDEESLALLKKEAGVRSVHDTSTLKKLSEACDNHPLTIRIVGHWIRHERSAARPSNCTEEVIGRLIKLCEDVKKGHPKGPQVSFIDEDELLFDVLESCMRSLFSTHRKALNLFAASITLLFWDETVTNPKIPLELARRFFERIALENNLNISQGVSGTSTLVDFVISSLQSIGIINVYSDEDRLTGIEYDVIQYNHKVLREHSETICANCQDTLGISLENIENEWNEAMVKTILEHSDDENGQTPNPIHIYSIKMLPGHLMRAGLFTDALNILKDTEFIQDRIKYLGLQKAEQFHRKECDALTEITVGSNKDVSLAEEYRLLADALGAFTHILSDYEHTSNFEQDFSNGQYLISCNNIGTILSNNGYWIESMSAYELGQAAISDRPSELMNNAYFMYNVGICLSELNLYPRALEMLSESLSLLKENPNEDVLPLSVVYAAEGDVMLHLCDLNNALKRYEIAIIELNELKTQNGRIFLAETQFKKASLQMTMGNMDDALKMFQNSLESKEALVGPRDPSLSSTYFKIGQIYLKNNKNAKSALNLNTALSLLEEIPILNDVNRVQMMLIKATIHKLKNNKNGTLTALNKTLQFYRFRFAYKKIEIATICRRIACLHMSLGSVKEAFEKFSQSLDLLKKCKCPIHLEVANVLISMSRAHMAHESPLVAIQCLEEALQIQKIRLGEFDKVSLTLEMLGDVSMKIGKPKQAEGYYEQALLSKRIMKPDSVSVAVLVEKIGDIMFAINANEEAMDYYHEALDVQKDKVGENHPNVATILSKIGKVWSHQKLYQKATQTLEEVLKIRRSNFGEDHSLVGEALDLLGTVDLHTDNLESALKRFWESLRIHQLHKDQLKVANTMKHIGDLYKKQKRYEVCLECYEESARIRKAENISKDETLAEYFILLGNLKSDMKKYDEALGHYQEAFDLRCQIFGNIDDRVAAVLKNMGYLEFRRGSMDDARIILERFVKIRKLNHTDDCVDFVNTLCLIGNIFRIQDHLEEANKTWKEALDIIMANGLSDEVPQLVITIENLLKKYESGFHLLVPEVAKQLNTEKALNRKKGGGLGSRLFRGNSFRSLSSQGSSKQT